MCVPAGIVPTKNVLAHTKTSFGRGFPDTNGSIDAPRVASL